MASGYYQLSGLECIPVYIYVLSSIDNRTNNSFPVWLGNTKEKVLKISKMSIIYSKIKVCISAV